MSLSAILASKDSCRYRGLNFARLFLRNVMIFSFSNSDLLSGALLNSFLKLILHFIDHMREVYFLEDSLFRVFFYVFFEPVWERSVLLLNEENFLHKLRDS